MTGKIPVLVQWFKDAQVASSVITVTGATPQLIVAQNPLRIRLLISCDSGGPVVTLFPLSPLSMQGFTALLSGNGVAEYNYTVDRDYGLCTCAWNCLFAGVTMEVTIVEVLLRG